MIPKSLPGFSTKLILNFVLSFLFSFCTPSKVIKLSPREASRGNYINGQYFMQKEQDSILTQLAFDEQKTGEIVFNIAVTNTKKEPVTIFPEQFFVLLNDSASLSGTQVKRLIIDPESRLNDVNRQIEEETNKYKSYLFLSGAQDVAFFLTDLATIKKKKTKEQIEKEERLRAERASDFERRTADHKRIMEELEKFKMKWAYTALRRNTLHKGQTVSGKLYFPFDKGHKYLTVIIFIGDHPVKFDFRVNEV